MTAPSPRRPRLIAALIATLVACGSSSRPAQPTSVTVTPPVLSVSAVASASASANTVPAPKPEWPAIVDLSLPAPDAFHLVAAKDDELLVDITGTIEFHERHMNNQLVRGDSHYFARMSLRTGCMEETYDFPTVGEAASTGTVTEALAVLAKPAMVAEVARAKELAATFGSNAGSIRVSPNARVVVLEANNEIYWAKDGALAFKHVPGVAKGPVMSSDGRHVAYGSGGGTYQLAILDVDTGHTRSLTRSPTGVMSTSEVWALSDGGFVAVETNGVGGRQATRVCVSRIDAQRFVETEIMCEPADVLSASLSVMSSDERWLAVHLERHGTPGREIVLDTKTWTKTTDVAGSPIYPDVDSRGRVGWETHSGRRRPIVIGEGSAVREIDVPAHADPELQPTFVGFAGDRLVVGYPAMPAFAFEGQALKKLRDIAPCGFVRAVRLP